MASVERTTHDNGEPIVLFLIGMRVNKPWLVHRWIPVMFAMPRMILELSREKDSGLLAFRYALAGGTLLVIQYWRSTADLERYANDAKRLHRPAWLRFYRGAGPSGAVGIFHETYAVDAGRHESLYGNMPPFGLARATGGAISLQEAKRRFADRIPTAS